MGDWGRKQALQDGHSRKKKNLWLGKGSKVRAIGSKVSKHRK